MSGEKWRRSPRMPALCQANLTDLSLSRVLRGSCQTNLTDLKPQTETSQARAQLLVLVVIKQGLAVGHLATGPVKAPDASEKSCRDFPRKVFTQTRFEKESCPCNSHNT